MKKELRKQRWRIYMASVLLTAVLPELLWLVYDVAMRKVEGILVGAILVLLLGAGTWIYRRFKALEERTFATETEYELRTYESLERLVDRYAKRKLNSAMLLATAIPLFFAAEIGMYVFGNSKPSELVESVFGNLWVIMIPLFLVIKNSLCLKMVKNRVNRGDGYTYRKHLIGLLIGILLYWSAVIALVIAFRERLYYPANVLLLALVVEAVAVLLYNLTLRRRVVTRNLVFNPLRAAMFGLLILGVVGYRFLQVDTWYTQPYINTVPAVEHASHGIQYDENTGVYTITKSTVDFKILHLTDIHLGGSLFSWRKDVKALKACYAEIENTHPDLVVVTGDLTFPLGIMSLSFNNEAPVQQFAAFMRNVGIPWCFTYGNHDTESVASLSKKGLDDLYQSLSYKTSKTLLYPYVQPEITGRNNQMIVLRNVDGSLNQALFLLDSNAYTEEGINTYDFIHDDQVDWYAERVRELNVQAGRVVPSLVFFHIPLQEYRTAYKLYEEGSSEVTYYFGSNDEKMINKICCSEYESKLFDTMCELQSTTGTFCGHDHYNNMSLAYRGIRLTYGMSIDYLAMPGIERDTKQRGAELITVHQDGGWDVRQIPLTSITTEKN